MTGQAIAHWEAGRSLPQAVEVPALAAALNVSICALYGVPEGHSVPSSVVLTDQLGKLLGVAPERVEVNVYGFAEKSGPTFEPTSAAVALRSLVRSWPSLSEVEQQELVDLADQVRTRPPA